jgi:hypothetical protein
VPLTRENITAASLRTLPTYPAFCVVVGATWALDPGSRLGATPALSFAGRWTPLFGLVVFAIGIWLTVAYALGQIDQDDRWRTRKLYNLGLGALLGWMIIWAGVLILAAALGSATWGAWAWPAAFARFSWATVVSLETRET